MPITPEEIKRIRTGSSQGTTSIKVTPEMVKQVRTATSQPATTPQPTHIKNTFNPAVAGSLANKFWAGAGGNALVGVQKAAQNYTPIRVMDLSSKIKNKTARFIVSIPEDYANMIYNTVTMRSPITTGKVIGLDITTGDIKKPQILLSDLAMVGEEVLNAYITGSVATGIQKSVTRNVGMALGKPTLTRIGETTANPGFWKSITKGALGTGKITGAYGALGGMVRSREAKTTKETITNVATDTAINTVFGLIFGAVTSGGSYAINKAFNKLFVSRVGTFTGKGSPENIEKSIIKNNLQDSQIGKDALKAVEYAKANGKDVGLQVYSLKQSSAGKLIGEDAVAKIFGVKNPSFEFKPEAGFTKDMKTHDGYVYRFVAIDKNIPNLTGDVTPVPPSKPIGLAEGGKAPTPPVVPVAPKVSLAPKPIETPVPKPQTTLEKEMIARKTITENKISGALKKYDNKPVKEGYIRTYQVIEKGATTDEVFDNENMLRDFTKSMDTSTSDINIKDYPKEQLEPTSQKGIYKIKSMKKRATAIGGFEEARPDKGSRPREVESVVAKTPEELKEILDDLNKYGQAHAIPRRFGGKMPRKAAGVYIHKGEGIGKEGEVRVKEKYAKGDREYLSIMAHELGHATEKHVTGEINKNTLSVFGKENHDKILKELKDVTLKLEGAEAIASEPVYYNRPTELLARFFEMYITNPELLQDTAPTAFEAIERQSVKDPMLGEFLNITNESLQKADKVKFQFLPDRRETYQKYLGKKVGNIVYDQEIVHRALVERAKNVLPKFIESKFKGIKDRPELLFRVAESIRETKNGQPEFGTRDFVELPTEEHNSNKSDDLRLAGFKVVQSKVIRNGEKMDVYARSRYTPEQSKELYNQLTPQGKELIKSFTAQLDEAKDFFNREMIKKVYGIESNLEGWVHHYFEKEPTRKAMSGKDLGFRQKKAAAAKHRTGSEGYIEDLQKAVTKAVVELQMSKDFNAFVGKQFARVSKPLREGENPDKGWVEVVGDVTRGVGLEADKRMVVVKDGKTFIPKRARYQIPKDVYERYNKYRGLVEEASGVAKMVQRLNSYWGVNILTHPGTAATNFIGGGIQYSAKVLTDFYNDLLTGDVRLTQTRKDISAMMKVLFPKGWATASDYVYGSDQSNWYGMFQNKAVNSSIDKGIDKFADINLKLFGTYERYWKKVISTAENVKDVKSLDKVGKEGLRVPTKEEEERIAKLNREVDLYAYDYDNVPLWLANMKKNPVMVGFKPFATYPYKYAKQVSNMIGAAFDRSLPWQERVAKLLSICTIIALYSAYSLKRKKQQQTPESTSPEIEIRSKSGGYAYTGLKDEEGKELFARVSKYPFIGLTEAGIQMVRGNTDAASNIFKEMIGSIGFIGDTSLNLLGYRTEYEKYDKPEIVLGNNLSGLVPYTRILNDLSRLLDPFMRKEKTFGQTLTKLIPTTSEDLQEKLHGEKRVVKIPIEGEIKRTPGTKYTRTTIDRVLKNYWQDILLSLLTGIYIKRVSPEDVKAQIIRDEKNLKEREKKGDVAK